MNAYLKMKIINEIMKEYPKEPDKEKYIKRKAILCGLTEKYLKKLVNEMKEVGLI